MRKMNLLVVLAIVLLGTTLMSAQATRTWVSGVGDDANPCSRTAPCKTFAGAISKTAPGGEIDALDPGGFGALTITKAITLDGGGGQVASVLVAGVNGIVVAAGASDVVIIRNLRLDGVLGGVSPGLNGIRFISGKDLNIENVYVFGFSQNCIDIALGASAQVHVVNTITKNCLGDGLKATTSAGLVTVGINNSSFLVSGNDGIEAGDHSRVVVNNSFIENAGANGVQTNSPANDAELTIDNSDISFNPSNAVQAGPGTTTNRVANCKIAFNGTAFAGAATQNLSYGTNRIHSNGSDGNFQADPQGQR